MDVKSFEQLALSTIKLKSTHASEVNIKISINYLRNVDPTFFPRLNIRKVFLINFSARLRLKRFKVIENGLVRSCHVIFFRNVEDRFRWMEDQIGV